MDKGITIAIVGRAESSNKLVNESKADLIWGIGGAYDDQPDVPHFDALFEIHPPEMISQPAYSTIHWGNLTAGEYGADKCYTMGDVPEIPDYRPYEIEPIKGLVPSSKRMPDPWKTMFGSSLDYCMALALLMHKRGEIVKCVEIYGFDMDEGKNTDTEYRYQRPTFRYWHGRLHGADIEVYIPDESSLAHGQMYAWEGGQIVTLEMMKKVEESLIGQRFVLKRNAERTADGKMIAGPLYWRVNSALFYLAKWKKENAIDLTGKGDLVFFRSLFDQIISAFENERDRHLAMKNSWGGKMNERINKAGLTLDEARSFDYAGDISEEMKAIEEAGDSAQRHGQMFYETDGGLQLAYHMLALCDNIAKPLVIKKVTSHQLDDDGKEIKE